MKEEMLKNIYDRLNNVADSLDPVCQKENIQELNRIADDVLLISDGWAMLLKIDEQEKIID